MSGAPDFSVVIPTWNRAGHVARCLAPFLEAHASGIDVTVVDDGSSDETEAEVTAAAGRSLGAAIRYVRQENAGPSAARNRGAGLALTDWLVFLDIDDRWFPWSIGEVRAALADAGPAALLFLGVKRFRADSELDAVQQGARRWSRADSFAAARGADPSFLMGSCNVAVRRAEFERTGGFDPGIRGHEDQDLFLRIAGQVLYVAEPPIVGYREGGEGSLTGNSRGMLEGMLFLLKGLDEGRYVADPALLRRILARSCRTWVHIFFARGHAREAYALLQAARGVMVAEYGALAVAKIAATPALSLTGAGNYRFGWSAARARRAGG